MFLDDRPRDGKTTWTIKDRIHVGNRAFYAHINTLKNKFINRTNKDESVSKFSQDPVPD